jgi:inhibitor of cysteine peptidase
MTTLGYIITSILGAVLVFFVYLLVKDIYWNQKLKSFHLKSGNLIAKVPKIFWIKRSYATIMTTLFIMTLVFSGVFQPPVILGEKMLVNAIPVNNAQTIKNLISQNNTHDFWQAITFGFRNEIALDGIQEDFAMAPGASSGSSYREYIGTNTQVKNVDEGDIVKTDGYQIYYATRFRNEVKVIDVNSDGSLTLLGNIDLGNLYTDSIYLTETKLIVIGYIYTYKIYESPELDFYYSFMYQAYSGAVYVYDRETLELDFKLETDSNFYNHRLVDNTLILISNKSIYDEELRPMFRTVLDAEEKTNYLGYNKIFYFKDVPITSMTVITSLNLDDYSYNSQAFLGYVDEIYMSYDSLYTVYNYYNYTQDNYKHYVQILKFDIDKINHSVNYVAQVVLEGYVEDQYWLDEFIVDDISYLRVVSSPRWDIHNKLFVLKEDSLTDQLIITGSITENLGLEGERVKSVRFNENDAYVVTFRETDPLYHIDLSNPLNPVIVSIEKAPGYSTSLFVWNHSSHLIGFGFDANDEGFITGLSLRAFKLSGSTEIKDDDDSVDSYVLGNENSETGYTYSYSEASYNPKAIMVDPTKNIIAFPVMSYKLTSSSPWNYEYSFEGKYLVFIIDFNAQNNEDIIKDPIVISHGVEDYYAAIDRGIYIDLTDDGIDNGYIYTLSHSKVASYNLATGQTVIYDLTSKDE